MRSRQRPGPVRDLDPWDGLLLVDKPAGPTSHDIVDAVRGHFGLAKVGHGGTLDPMATGLLVILLGRGTKLSDVVMGSDKTYEGTMELGVTTDTDDIDGEVTSRADASGVTRERLEAEMAKFAGDLMQTPPMVSAVKVGGVPLYKLARKGKTVEREPRLIHVYEFSLRGYEPPLASFVLRCTKGTYVRTICSDIGRALGCGAYLRRLHRTRSGKLRVEDAVRFEELMEMAEADVARRVIPIHTLRPGDFDR